MSQVTFYWSDDRIPVCELATNQSLGDFTVPGVLMVWPFSDGTRIHLVRTPLAAP